MPEYTGEEWFRTSREDRNVFGQQQVILTADTPEGAEAIEDARAGAEQPSKNPGGVWITTEELADLMTPASSTLPWTEENQLVVKGAAARINNKWLRILRHDEAPAEQPSRDDPANDPLTREAIEQAAAGGDPVAQILLGRLLARDKLRGEFEMYSPEARSRFLTRLDTGQQPSRYSPESINHQREMVGLPPIQEPLTEAEETPMAENTVTPSPEAEILLAEYDQLIDFINGDPIDGVPKKKAIREGIMVRRNELARLVAIAHTTGHRPEDEVPTAQQPSSEPRTSLGEIFRRVLAEQIAEDHAEDHAERIAEEPTAEELANLNRQLAARFILEELRMLAERLIRD